MSGKRPIKTALDEFKWMKCPNLATEYPGLAYILPLDELIIVKRSDALHKVIGNHSQSYTIFNRSGEKIFIAAQASKRYVKIFNVYGNEVIQIQKTVKLFIRSATRVWAPAGNYAGFILQRFILSRNSFIVNNADESIDLEIRGRDKTDCCGVGLVYNITHQGVVIGKIQKFTSWNKPSLGDKNFGVSFPVEMDIGLKAVLLGACFLTSYLKDC